MNNNTTLFQEFEKTDTQSVLKEILKELKGKDLPALQVPTYEGITISPYYATENLPNPLPKLKFPAKKGNSWYNQVILEQATPEKIQQALDSGATAIKLKSEGKLSTEVEKYLAKISEKEVPITLKTTLTEKLPADSMLRHLTCLEVDTLMCWTQSGEMAQNNWEILADVFQNLPSTKTRFLINATIFENAGGNAVETLAFTLAAAVEYLHQLSEKGVPLENIFQRLQFSLTVGNHYFMEIAKFRALRLLWEKVAEAYQQNPIIWIDAQTSLWNKSPQDIYNNMLRSTTEAMAAVIAGVDILTVLPYNMSFETVDDFATRIAINTSTILREEAHIDKVRDVGAGSYFIEYLTHEIVQKSWKLFQEVEQRGGFKQCFETGWITQHIAHTAQQKIEDFKAGKIVLVGTNKYQNPKDSQRNIANSSTEATQDFPLLKPLSLSNFL